MEITLELDPAYKSDLHNHIFNEMNINDDADKALRMTRTPLSW